MWQLNTRFSQWLSPWLEGEKIRKTAKWCEGWLESQGLTKQLPLLCLQENPSNECPSILLICDLMFLLFSECRTLPFRFGIASHKTCCSPFYCSAWSHDFVVTDAATRHRRVSVTDTSTQTSYCHHRDLVATSFSDFLPLFCWDSTLHPPELFPFLDDAKLICSLRPTRTPCFTCVNRLRARSLPGCLFLNI